MNLERFCVSEQRPWFSVQISLESFEQVFVKKTTGQPHNHSTQVNYNSMVAINKMF